jgi:hypothetical protein
MNILNLSAIVEGHGDVRAVPFLLRRIQQSVRPDLTLNVLRPWRIGRCKLVRPGEIERTVQLAARKAPSPRAILILVDADDDPPCILGPGLLARAREARRDVPIGVVLAKREYEAWFLAAIDSISGHRGLREDVASIPQPESVRDAKGLLTSSMKGTRAYSEVLDQPALTAVFDMELARKRSDSFDKCWREVVRLLESASDQ